MYSVGTRANAVTSASRSPPVTRHTVCWTPSGALKSAIGSPDDARSATRSTSGSARYVRNTGPVCAPSAASPGAGRSARNGRTAAMNHKCITNHKDHHVPDRVRRLEVSPSMRTRRTFVVTAVLSLLVGLPLAAQWPAAEKLDLDAIY